MEPLTQPLVLLVAIHFLVQHYHQDKPRARPCLFRAAGTMGVTEFAAKGIALAQTEAEGRS
jgi:hypothetical protein